MFQYLCYKIGLFIINGVPRKSAYAFARWLSEQHFRCSTKDREAVMRNLRQILRTDEGLYEKAREVFQNFGRYLVDFFLMYKTVNEKFVRENTVIHGREHLEAGFARGKGVIILTAHIGNWEMGAAILAQLGHPVTAVALPHKERKVNELFNRQRENYGVTVVPTSAAVRRCMEALRKNWCVALLGDRDFGFFGEPLPFLGRPTLIPKGAAFFASRTGAAIVPSFIIPLPNGKYELSFQAPILAEAGVSDDDKGALIALMKKCVEPIERKIREYPTQWLMFREFGIEYEDLHSDPRVQRVRGARSGR